MTNQSELLRSQCPQCETPWCSLCAFVSLWFNSVRTYPTGIKRNIPRRFPIAGSAKWAYLHPTMKTLFLVRHAKSSWADFSVADIDRPLNDRGKRDAPVMAERLKKRGLKIEALVSSPAKRAHKTAKLFAEVLDLPKKEILIQDDLYEAGVQQFNSVVQHLNDQFNTVALFSHNPGITDFVNTLTPTRIDNMPTCGIFAVTIKADSWRYAVHAEKEFLFFDFPKNEEE